MANNCPICDTESVLAAKLQAGTILQCPACYWAFSQDMKITPFEKHDLDEDKRNEYLAIVQKASLYSDLSREGDKVLDINSGDGTLLGWYLKGPVTVGVEPNAALMKTALNQHRVDVPVIKEFSAEAVSHIGKFKIITVVDVFQNFNPKALKDLGDLLSDTGVIVLQVPYLLNLVKDSKDLPCKNYFLVFTLRHLFTTSGLTLQGVEVIKQNVRAYGTKPNFKMFASNDYESKLKLYTTMSVAIMEELHSRFDTIAPYQTLEEKIRENRWEARDGIPVYQPPSKP